MKKCFFSAKCIFAQLGAKIFFLREKKWIPDSKYFPFFMPKPNFFRFFDPPPDFRAEGPKKNMAHFFYFFFLFGGWGVPPGVGGGPPPPNMVFVGVGPLSLRKVPPVCTPRWCHKKHCGPPPCRLYFWEGTLKGTRGPHLYP